MISRSLRAFGVSLAMAAMAVAQPSLPSKFRHQTIASPVVAEIYVRSGGSGPVVVLIHGFGDAGHTWGPLAGKLAKAHTLIVPDLRGMGTP